MDILTAQEIASRFSMLDMDSLIELSCRSDVMMSHSELSALKIYFNNYQYRAPSVGELIFFDAFFGSLSDAPEHYATTGFGTNCECLASTFSDLLNKYSKLYPDNAFPCSLKKAFELGFEAISNNSGHAFSMSDRKMFVGDTNKTASLRALSEGYEPELFINGICIAKNTHEKMRTKPIKRGVAYATVIVYPCHGTEPDGLYSFVRKAVKSKKALHLITCRGKDIFRSIYEVSKDLSVNAEKLPLSLQDSYRSADIYSESAKALFTDSVFGEHAVAVFCKKHNLKRICSMAKKLGLETSTAINITKTRGIKILMNGSLFSELRSDSFAATVLPQELKHKIDYRDPVIAEPLPCSVNSPEPDELFYSVSTPIPVDAAAFNTAAASILTPLIYASYDGSNIKNSELSLSVNLFVDILNKEYAECSFAAVLGIYRAVTELGIPVNSYAVHITDGAPSISVCLHAHKFDNCATLVTDLSKEELAETILKSSHIPDFEAIRQLING